ncbi:inactive histone-lysine N-methyltransferase 2E isoform X2 [Diabrotica virgifera virgifera]|uniref:Inactive histone-lysine N-methyltransferase 2E isoform X2 n=1 Tax=Diabrotica virgifera virgifera TaxID=50390 RepID=A0A6P7G795_DIAVI|nr:inactive histone-lysine N-methyltransferase 2E isoform X2 [Diabrotica virgifera virgifera]
MSQVERKEYQESKVMRTVSPARRNYSSNQNLSQFDSNLDYLLEDLQNSVSRPGSSLGYNSSGSHTHRETSRVVDTGRSNSLNRIAQLKPSNPVEYSSDDAYNYTSPDGNQKVSGYKKEKYIYKTTSEDITPDKIRTQNSINQLDNLLDDLQQVKKSSFLDSETYNSPGSDPKYQSSISKKSINRELHYGDTPRSSSRSRTLERDGTLQRDVEYISEGGVLVKETITTRNYQPGYRVDKNPPTTNQTYIYNETNTTTKNVDNGYPPAPPPPPAQNTYILKETTTNVNQSEPPRSYPHQPGKETYILKETHNTNVTEYPQRPEPYQPGKQTYIIKETHNTTVNDRYPPPPPQQPESYPPGRETYIIKETHNTTVNDRPYSERGYPVYNPPDERNPPTNTTYFYEETTNTTTSNRPGSPYHNGYPPAEPPKTIVYKQETHTTNNTYGPNRPRPDVETFDPNNPPYGFKKNPNEPINIHYSYKSTSKTENNYKGGYPPNGETESLLPKKFPTHDGPDGPPKKLDELMATIGREPPNSPLNAGFLQHEEEKAHQKKVDSLKQKSEVETLQKKEPPPKSKNIAGPPVYYPPGEMFLKKEEGGEAWRAQGGYARASGKYQYEAESRSKSKSSSGAAVVPVCLPLCCGLPCTIL